MDPTLVDWSSDPYAALQVEVGYPAYAEDNQDIHESSHTSTSNALQSNPSACWQSFKVQPFSVVEESVTVDSAASSTNNSNHVVKPVFSPSSGGNHTSAGTEKLSRERSRDRELSFHRWQQSGQQPNNTKSKLQLADGHGGPGTFDATFDEREAKRPKLTPSNEDSGWPHDIEDLNNSNCNDNGSGESPGFPHSKRDFDAATSYNECLISPPASIYSNAVAVSSTYPLGQCRSHRGEEATSNEPHEADESSPSCAILQTKYPLPGVQYMRQASQCNSCSTFRAALLEALSLLQRLLDEDVPSTGCEPADGASNLSYSLNNRSSDGIVGCGERSNRDSCCIEDDEISTIQVEGANPCGQHRKLTQLEERRLRAWRRENKSESWIAAKLNNTKSAGSNFGRRRTQKSSTRAKFTSDEDYLIRTLKEEEQLAWTEIQERHGNQFHTRSKESLQVRYCTKLKNRGTA